MRSASCGNATLIRDGALTGRPARSISQTFSDAAKGQKNAESLFGLDQVPSDPHMRNLLDPIAPEHLAPPFWRVFEQLREGAYLTAYQGHRDPWLCACDGTQDFSSQQIHCAPCTIRVSNGRTNYSHTLVAPQSVAPDENRVIRPGT